MKNMKKHEGIPIPEGMDEAQEAALTQWLSQKAAEATHERLPCENDPEWQAETAARIKRGMAEIEAGQGIPARQAMEETAKKYGLNLPK